MKKHKKWHASLLQPSDITDYIAHKCDRTGKQRTQDYKKRDVQRSVFQICVYDETEVTVEPNV